MSTIFDAIGNDFDKFIAAAEEVFPDFKKKMESKLKEDVDAELLQEEQNLTEKIDDIANTVDELTREHDEISNKLDGARVNLRKLMIEREEIHKKWIALHPTTVRPMKLQAIIPDKIVDDPAYVKKPDFHLAFNAIRNMQDNHFNEESEKKFFKRFDNLVHARCKTCEMFGYDWDIINVINSLDEWHCTDLADEILAFHESCENKQKQASK